MQIYQQPSFWWLDTGCHFKGMLIPQVKLNGGQDFINLDETLVDLKLGPEVLEVPVPRFFCEDRAKASCSCSCSGASGCHVPACISKSRVSFWCISCHGPAHVQLIEEDRSLRKTVSQTDSGRVGLCTTSFLMRQDDLHKLSASDEPSAAALSSHDTSDSSAQ